MTARRHAETTRRAGRGRWLIPVMATTLVFGPLPTAAAAANTIDAAGPVAQSSRLDRTTPTMLGAQVLSSGDDDPVTWTALRNVQATTDGTLRKTVGGANAQDAGAISTQLIGPSHPFNAVEFGWPEALTKAGCIGLNAADLGTSCSEIRYRLVLQPYDGGALATAYDNTTWCGETMFSGTDRLRISTVDRAVAFARNGVRFATCASTPPAQQQVDTSLWDLGSTVSTARLLRVTSFAEYQFVATTDPAGTKALRNGSVVAVFTTNARTVRFTAPPRRFSEPSATPRSVVVSVQIRRLPSDTPWQPQMVNEAWFQPWFLAAVQDTSPDLLEVAMRYITGAPPNYPEEGDAHYGPEVNGVRQEGADYNDFLGRTVYYPRESDPGQLEPAAPDPTQVRSLDCSGYVRMIYGYRMGWPLKRYDTRTQPPLGIPRRAVGMAGTTIGVEIVTRNGDARPPDAALARLAPGDLVFFDAHDDDGDAIDHVGIYLGVDDGMDGGNPDERPYHRFLSSRKTVDGPTLGDIGGWSVLDRQNSLYTLSFRSARRI
jgi:hypothetical protein